MTGEEQYDYNETPRCAYCGSPNVKRAWSRPSRGQYYCSLECQVKDHKTLSLLCGVCCLPVMILLSIEMVLSVPPPGNQSSNGYLLQFQSGLLVLEILLGVQLYLALKPGKRAPGP